MALWRALALLSMIVLAVASKRQEKPVLSTRMALSYIYSNLTSASSIAIPLSEDARHPTPNERVGDTASQDMA